MKNVISGGVICLVSLLGGQWLQAQQAAGPTDAKAQKTYANGVDWEKRHFYDSAIGSFKKADKQDGGHCVACQQQVIRLGLETGDFKSADAAAQEVIAETPASDVKALALAHENRASVLLREGMNQNKDDAYAEADKEFKTALTEYPNFPEAMYGDGVALAHLKQDDAAKAEFTSFLAANSGDAAIRMRAQRFAARPELARARMAPPFSVTTLSGQQLSLDELQGKVVLIDFWATWCGPCREALPHIQDIAKKFQGQPLVILSVSLDSDEAKWKDFVAKNNMTWMQYRDGGFDGSVAKLFSVHAIPHTFTIDPDGVLQDEHIGDASIEGKLKKLCVEARAMEEAPRTVAAAGQ